MSNETGKLMMFGFAGLFLAPFLAIGSIAFMGLVIKILVNFIAVSTNHPQYQITFWPAAAIAVLLGVVGSLFRSGR